MNTIPFHITAINMLVSYISFIAKCSFVYTLLGKLLYNTINAYLILTHHALQQQEIRFVASILLYKPYKNIKIHHHKLKTNIFTAIFASYFRNQLKKLTTLTDI